eukprot:scaffold237730_cov52-Cyclotella_meneghiniana.AAC.1
MQGLRNQFRFTLASIPQPTTGRTIILAFQWCRGMLGPPGKYRGTKNGYPGIIDRQTSRRPIAHFLSHSRFSHSGIFQDPVHETKPRLLLVIDFPQSIDHVCFISTKVRNTVDAI